MKLHLSKFYYNQSKTKNCVDFLSFFSVSEDSAIKHLKVIDTIINKN